MFRGTWIHNIIDIAFPFKWKNSLKVPEKKKKKRKYFLFSVFYFPSKQRFLIINEQILSLHSYCSTKIKICIALSYLTAEKALEKTHWVTTQLYVWIKTEHTLFCLFCQKRNIFFFQPQSTEYCIILEMSIKGRQEWSVKNGVSNIWQMNFYTHIEVRSTSSRANKFELTVRFLRLRWKSVSDFSDCAGLQCTMAAKCSHHHPDCI